jgi:hypothetical protein
VASSLYLRFLVRRFLVRPRIKPFSPSSSSKSFSSSSKTSSSQSLQAAASTKELQPTGQLLISRKSASSSMDSISLEIATMTQGPQPLSLTARDPIDGRHQVLSPLELTIIKEPQHVPTSPQHYPLPPFGQPGCTRRYCCQCKEHHRPEQTRVCEHEKCSDCTGGGKRLAEGYSKVVNEKNSVTSTDRSRITEFNRPICKKCRFDIDGICECGNSMPGLGPSCSLY